MSRARRLRTSRVREYTWDYLTAKQPEPVGVDPEIDLGRHENDLPDGWREPIGSSGWSNPAAAVTAGPGVGTGSRVDVAFDQATHWIFHALYAAGFGFDEAHYFMSRHNRLHLMRDAVDEMWEYRRFGIPMERATPWYEAGFAAHLARVFIDAGMTPPSAKRLHMYIAASALAHRQTAESYFHGRALMAVLEHGVHRARAVVYALAGCTRHEVADFEARRAAGEDIDPAIATIAALRGTSADAK